MSTTKWETELLDWISACESAYHIDNTPGHRFGGLGSNRDENRAAAVEYVRELISEASTSTICALSDAARDALGERRRQIECEGFTPAHDDFHSPVELIRAACCYALHADSYPNRGEPPPAWPWDAGWWKPKDSRRDNIRAIALMLAAVELNDMRSSLEKAERARE